MLKWALTLCAEASPHVTGTEAALNPFPHHRSRQGRKLSIATLGERITGMKPIAGNSFPATFGHIMSGYDAGYYSYMWSEAYSLDIFSQFQKEGLSNQATGMRYRNAILSQGDLKDGDALLREFLGREPNSDAFFKKLNITQGR